MDQQRLTYLFERYLQNSLTPEEHAEFQELMRRPETEVDVKRLLDEFIHEQEEEPPVHTLHTETAQSIYHSIIEADQEPAPAKRLFHWRYWLAAASVLALVLTGVFIANERSRPKAIVAHQVQDAHLPPGKDAAILILGDGSRIVLDKTENGNLRSPQSSVDIIKLNGQLTYRSSGAQSGAIEYNTITTPRGGQYKLVLADGTKVWLNAASSLRFPTVFTGEKRAIELSGEGYFEVAKDAARPFYVQTGEVTVLVLGTHFNIHAYAGDDPIKTTLLEGKVKVASANEFKMLAPGQQATWQHQTFQVADDVDTESVVAWKNGLFHLNSADVPSIMKQIARWYDVDVQYESKIPNAHISGKMSRNLNLTQVLKILEHSGLHCRLSGRTVTVLPE